MKEFIYTLIFVCLIVTISTTTVFAGSPFDVNNNHWAESYITRLLNQDVMYVYDDYSFAPERAITRGEVAYSLARLLNLSSVGEADFTDLDNYFASEEVLALVEEGIINGYPDNTFRPHSQITRAEMIAMLARSLRLDQEEYRVNLNHDTFSDVDSSHWANHLITLAARLNIINGYPDGSFKPNNNITRAEAAKLLVELDNLTTVTGQIIESYPNSNAINLKTDNQRRRFLLNDDVLIARNNRQVTLEDLLVADETYLLLDDNGEGIYLAGYGLITEDDVAENLSEMTNDLLSGEDLKALVNGEWEKVGTTAANNLISSFLEQGLTEEEIAAAMAGEWDQLQELSQQRMIEVIASATNVPAAIIEAAIEQDWQRAEEISRTNALRAGIEQIMSSSWLR